MIKIWLDDVRQAPDGYIHCHSVNETIDHLRNESVEELDLDHDLGIYAKDGGDAINLLDWCVEHRIYPRVKFHTANPVGKANMQRLVERHWPF